LEELNISENGVTDEGGVELAIVLKENKRLTRLNFSNSFYYSQRTISFKIKQESYLHKY